MDRHCQSPPFHVLHLSACSLFPGNASCTHQCIVKQVEIKMRRGFKSIWFQRPDRWDFFGSLFFCCTVFTTVGKSAELPCINMIAHVYVCA